MSETLIPQGFLDIEKERKLQYQWYHNFRSYVVWVAGLDSPSSTDVGPVVSVAPPERHSLPTVQVLLHHKRHQKRHPTDVFFDGAVSDDKSEPNASSISAKVIVFVPSL